jgi:hypothetical protein
MRKQNKKMGDRERIERLFMRIEGDDTAKKI